MAPKYMRRFRISATLFLLISTVACSTLAAQTPAPAPKPDSTTASSAMPQLSFDVVSIRQNVSGSHEMTRQSAADTDDITMTNVPLALVVYYAYLINDENLIRALPDWTFSERYDVTAKVAPENLAAYHALTGRQRAAMLQAVLADRFKLQAHHEAKNWPVYALVVAKGGPKLKAATAGEAHPNTVKANPGGFVHGATIFVTGSGEITAEAASMGDLATALSNGAPVSLGRPVIDQTGLTGKYDFTLQTPPPTSNGDDAQQEKTASLFGALQDQLGLKLQPTTAPTDYLVIDHIERPSAN